MRRIICTKEEYNKVKEKRTKRKIEKIK